MTPLQAGLSRWSRVFPKRHCPRLPYRIGAGASSIHLSVGWSAAIAEVGSLGGKGGVIAVGPDGTGGWAFNTPSMYRGIAGAGREPMVAIYGDEER